MAKSFSFRKALERSEKSMASAFKDAEVRMGLHKSPDVAVYSQLTPEDFQDMAKDFGETDVLQYIHELEKKRLMEE